MTRLTRLKVVLIFFSLEMLGVTTSDATLKEDCAASYRAILACQNVYDRVTQRVVQNQRSYQSLLNKGHQNNTLMGEIQRDVAYLTLSEPLMTQLAPLKKLLESVVHESINLHVNAITDMLSQANRLVAEHEDVFEQTLMDPSK